MKVQLSLCAKGLKNVAGAFKGVSDPFAVVTLISSKSNVCPVLGKTEVIKNTLSPDWVKVFILDYELGTPMKIGIAVFDKVSKGSNKSMGSVVFDIPKVIAAKGGSKGKQISKGRGVVRVHVDKSKGSGSFNLKMSGIKLKNVEGFMRKSDPFYELSRLDAGNLGSKWNVVYRSKHIKNNLNPIWEETGAINLDILCSGNLELPILISVFDHESDGKHVLMGKAETNVSRLVASKGSSELSLSTHKGEKGKLAIHKAEVHAIDETRNFKNDVEKPLENRVLEPNFFDYVRGGCEINLSVAIDFTGSNGDPRHPSSLHYISDTTKNDYEKAISAIGSCLAEYDTDKKFPVWGFGAKLGGSIRHCFQCGSEREVDGVDGIIDAYHDTFNSGLVMSGPTDITEVLQTAAAFAKSGLETAMTKGNQTYTILLILTDGCMSDIRKTAKILDSISDAPMSIVIVGIGNANFSDMQFLDDNGKCDIVQFVEFSKHKNDPDSLTSATLEEIPSQFTRYFTRSGIDPLPPIQIEEEDIVVEAEEEEFDLSVSFDLNNSILMTANNIGTYTPPKAY